MRVRGLANRARAEAGAVAVADRLVHGRADYRHIRSGLFELLGVLDKRPIAERQGDARVCRNLRAQEELVGLVPAVDAGKVGPGVLVSHRTVPRLGESPPVSTEV